jgi:hypothetical protein
MCLLPLSKPTWLQQSKQQVQRHYDVENLVASRTEEFCRDRIIHDMMEDDVKKIFETVGYQQLSEGES